MGLRNGYKYSDWGDKEFVESVYWNRANSLEYTLSQEKSGCQFHKYVSISASSLDSSWNHIHPNAFESDFQTMPCSSSGFRDPKPLWLWGRCHPPSHSRFGRECTPHIPYLYWRVQRMPKWCDQWYLRWRLEHSVPAKSSQESQREHKFILYKKNQIEMK